METFNLISPSAALAPYIKHYWVLRFNVVSPVIERTLPVGCVHLTFHRGSRLLSLTGGELQPRVFISGQSPSYADVQSTGSIDMFNVVFQPCAPRIFFQLPIHLLHSTLVSVEAMEDSALTDLGKRIANTPDDALCVSLIESFLLKRLHHFSIYNINRMKAVVHQVNLSPQASTSTLAEAACLSKKQFNRVFAEYIGTTPKEFLRIIRMQRTLHILQMQPGINFAQLADACGYYDQSHLIKEFKTFTGYTPGEYLTICTPYSDYFSIL